MKTKKTISRAALLGATLFPLLLVPLAADAQGALGRLKDRVGRRIEEKVGERVDRAVDRTLNGEEGTDPGAADPAATASARPGEGAWANYDFVPGERILYADDLTADRVGNFPQRMEFVSGSAQVVEWRGRRWLSAHDGELYINLPEALPQRFTMEFQLAGRGNPMQINFGGAGRNEQPYLEIGTDHARFRGSVDARGELRAETGERPVTIRIAVDGDYLKVYADEHRALNIPNAKTPRGKRIHLFLNGWSAEEPRMIGDLRIAAGGREMYDALLADGRVATQGILFDTGSDRIRPESTPILKQITEMMRRHPELRIAIEGHTDDVGNAQANQSLSDKRAAAVRAYLLGEGIAESRLQSRGLGASKPAVPNGTPEGRQQNRRVELVKL